MTLVFSGCTSPPRVAVHLSETDVLPPCLFSLITPSRYRVACTIHRPPPCEEVDENTQSAIRVNLHQVVSPVREFQLSKNRSYLRTPRRRPGRALDDPTLAPSECPRRPAVCLPILVWPAPSLRSGRHWYLLPLWDFVVVMIAFLGVPDWPRCGVCAPRPCVTCDRGGPKLAFPRGLGGRWIP